VKGNVVIKTLYRTAEKALFYEIWDGEHHPDCHPLSQPGPFVAPGIGSTINYLRKHYQVVGTSAKSDHQWTVLLKEMHNARNTKN
jgi:hypothetical protein